MKEPMRQAGGIQSVAGSEFGTVISFAGPMSTEADGHEAIHAGDSALGGLASGAVLSFGGQRHVSAVADVRASKRDAGCTRFGADVSAAQIDSAGEVHMSSGVASNDFHVSACGSEAISDVDGRDDASLPLPGGCHASRDIGLGAESSLAGSAPLPDFAVLTCELCRKPSQKAEFLGAPVHLGLTFVQFGLAPVQIGLTFVQRLSLEIEVRLPGVLHSVALP